MNDLSPHWQVLDPTPDAARSLAQRLDLPAWLAQVLCHRGYTEPEQAAGFLDVNLGSLPDPQGILGLEDALKVLVPAITKGDTIGVAGDYDADGVTATALLVDFLGQLGAPVVWELPHRVEDGYGFSPQVAERLARAGAQVAVTVDCGASDHLGVARAQELGMRVVVTDHHQLPPGPLPPAEAVINPQREGCAASCHLAGVGVAFYLAAALRMALREAGYFKDRPAPNLRDSLDLVALGTCADVVPLLDANRILVQEGLKVLEAGGRPGLAALTQVTGIRPPLDTRDLGFSLAPRINAAGRLEHAAPALELLLSKDPQEALALALMLDRVNRRRRQVEDRVLSQAINQVEASAEMDQAPCLVLSGQGWHRGVLGIVASRLVERYGRPVMLFGVENGKAVGSGRSVVGFHLQKALTGLEPMLLAYGGHALAAAATLATADLPRFAEDLTRAASDAGMPGEPAPLRIEALAGLDELGPRSMTPLTRLAPFGEGNPEPMLAVRGVAAESCKVVGSGHLKLSLRQNGHTLPAIGFNLAHLFPARGEGLWDVAGTPHISTYGGVHLELVLKDLRSLA